MTGLEFRSGSSFHALANEGKINLRHGVRAVSLDGKDLLLSDGSRITDVDAIVLCTGYTSSWVFFSEEDMRRTGLCLYDPPKTVTNKFDYSSLANPPEAAYPDLPEPHLYRGLIPIERLDRRDLAVTSTIFSAAPGFTWFLAAN